MSRSVFGVRECIACTRQALDATMRNIVGPTASFACAGLAQDRLTVEEADTFETSGVRTEHATSRQQARVIDDTGGVPHVPARAAAQMNLSTSQTERAPFHNNTNVLD